MEHSLTAGEAPLADSAILPVVCFESAAEPEPVLLLAPWTWAEPVRKRKKQQRPPHWP